MCKRNSPQKRKADKNEASMGCVRETPEIKMMCKRNSPHKKKPARDVQYKLPT